VFRGVRRSKLTEGDSQSDKSQAQVSTRLDGGRVPLVANKDWLGSFPMSRSIRLPAFVVAFLSALLWATAGAAGADWTLVKMSGDVRITGVAAQPIALRNGTLVRAGQTITTGSNGRALLVRGNDTVSVGPGTVLSVPPTPVLNLPTVLYQSVGVIELTVEKLGRPHFAVETPYLAALVKGTRFTVTVSARGASVAVSEGQVEVSDNLTGDTVSVTAGQSASVGQDRIGLEVFGVQPPEVRRGPGTPRIPAGAIVSADASAATGGRGRGGHDRDGNDGRHAVNTAGSGNQDKYDDNSRDDGNRHGDDNSGNGSGGDNGNSGSGGGNGNSGNGGGDGNSGGGNSGGGNSGSG
jgi:hypothetical protein